MSERNYYEVLGISPGADGTTVNRAYWQLARKYQAEESADPRSHLMLDELNEAYNTLGTPVLRQSYDADPAHLQAAVPEMPPSGPSGSHGAAPSGLPSIALPALALRTRLPMAVGGLVAVAGCAGGLWVGSFILAILGVSAGVVIRVDPLRNAILSSWRAYISRGKAAPTAPPPAVRERTATGSASVARRRQPALKTDDLRASTASMVSRFRTSVASAAEEPEPETMPDSTLVDIFRSERELETQSEPLTAVLDVLRGARNPVESR